MSITFKFLTSLLLALVVGHVGATPISSLADPALNGSTLIDFEGVTLGEYNSLVLSGVTINGNGSTMTICEGCRRWRWHLWVILVDRCKNTSGTPNSFDLVFDDVVSAFGIVGGALNGPWIYSGV